MVHVISSVQPFNFSEIINLSSLERHMLSTSFTTYGIYHQRLNLSINDIVPSLTRAHGAGGEDGVHLVISANIHG